MSVLKLLVGVLTSLLFRVVATGNGHAVSDTEDEEDVTIAVALPILAVVHHHALPSSDTSGYCLFWTKLNQGIEPHTRHSHLQNLCQFTSRVFTRMYGQCHCLSGRQSYF